MPRSVKDSDEDTELKTGRKTRMLITQSVVGSPVRRSSRIKQFAMQTSTILESSENDINSISKNPQQSTKAMQQIGTMNSAATEIFKKRRTASLLLSSANTENTAETENINMGTPKKTARKNLAVTSVDSPISSKINTRSASKRLIRASSEANSPPGIRTTRRTRANSVDPETMFNQSKNQSNVPVKTHRRASMLPLRSIIKEEIEKNKVSNLESKLALIEVDESTSSVEEQNISTSTHLTTDTTTDAVSTQSTSSPQCNKEIKMKTIEGEENPLTESDQSIVKKLWRKSAAKELVVKICNVMDVSTEQQKKESPSNKENQTLNINNNVSTEKTVEPVISNVISPNLISTFVNKSLNEKETKSRSMRSLDRSKEIMDVTVDYVSPSKNLVEKKMDTSSHNLSRDRTDENKNLDSPLRDNRNKNLSSIHITDNVESICKITTGDKTTTTGDKIPIENVNESNEKLLEISGTSDKIKNNDSQENSNLTADDNSEIKLVLEEQNVCCDKLFDNDSMETSKNFIFDLPNPLIAAESLSPKIYSKESTSIDRESHVIHNDAKSNSMKDLEKIKKTEVEKDSSKNRIEEESSNVVSKESCANNTVNQDINQSSNIVEVTERMVLVSLDKIDLKNIPMETVKGKNIKISSIETKGRNLQLEMCEETDTKSVSSDLDSHYNLFQDIPTAEWKEKITKQNNYENNSMYLNSPYPAKKLLESPESEVESDFEIETIKCFDSESDFLLSESCSNLLTPAYSHKKDIVVRENIPDTDTENVMDINKSLEAEEMIPIKKRKSLHKEMDISKKGENSSAFVEKANSSTSSNVSPNKPKTILNQSNNQSASKLKPATKAKEHLKDDVNLLHGNSPMTKKNTSLSEPAEKMSLKKSPKIIPSKQSDQSTQNISANKSEDEESVEDKDEDEEKVDNTDIHMKNKLKKGKRSLNKSKVCSSKDADDSIESVNKEKSMSNKKDKSFVVDRKSNSMITNLSTSDKLSNNDDFNDNDTDSSSGVEIPSFIFSLDNDDTNDDDDSNSDASSIDIDIKQEYNLDGAKQEIFEDDNVPGDLCRASETEHSDSDDNGSDLADFIDDDEVEDEEEENTDQEKDDDDEDVAVETIEIAEEKEVVRSVKHKHDIENNDEDTEVNVENKNDEQERMKKSDKKHKSNIIYIETTDEEEEEESASARMKTIEIDNDNTLVKLSNSRKNKKKEAIEYLSDTTKTKNDDVRAKKTPTKKNEETIFLDTSDTSDLSSSKKKKKSKVQSFLEDMTEEQSSVTSSNKSVEKVIKGKLHLASIKCSTPKFGSSKPEIEADIKELEMDAETSDKELNDTNEIMCSGSWSKKRKESKQDSTLKENINLKELKSTKKEKTLLHSSLPLLEMKAGNSSKQLSKTILHKTMNITHTETPTIRHLRKEKLSESAPVLREPCTENDRCKTKQNKSDTRSNVAQMEVKENSKKISDPAMPDNNKMQKPNRQKRKKRKVRTDDEEMSNEVVVCKDLTEDRMESNVTKKKKRKLDKSNKLTTTEEDDTCKDTNRINEKKKKKRVKIIEQDENVNTDKVLLKNVQENEVQLVQRNKKKTDKTESSSKTDASTADNCMIAKKKTKQQKVSENEASSEKLPKKIRKRDKEETGVSLSQAGVSKLKLKSSKTESEEAKNSAFVKARDEVLEAIQHTTERIKLKELKKKKNRDVKTTIQEVKQETGTLTEQNRQQKREKNVEKQMLQSSTKTGLKRLPDDVIDNLSHVPKKRKLSQKEKQIVPSQSMSGSSKFKESKVKDNSFIALSSRGGTTQFSIVNLQKAKKQRPNVAPALSFKERMLNRNQRQPVSAYLMYLEKRRVSNDGFSHNAR